MIGAARFRTVVISSLAVLLGALVLPYGFRALLTIPEGLAALLFWGYLAGGLFMITVLLLCAWVALWPAAPFFIMKPGSLEPRSPDPREARAALLAYPARVATASTGAGLLAVAAGWLMLMVGGAPAPLVLSLSTTTAALIGLSWLLIYALAQHAVRPLLGRLGRLAGTDLELGMHQPMIAPRGRLAFTLFMVVAAATVPAAVFAHAYLERVLTHAERTQAERTAGWLRQLSQGAGPAGAARLIEGVRLSHAITREDEGGTDGRRGVDLAVHGQRYLVLYGQPVEPPLSMAISIVLLLIACALVAGGLEAVLREDLAGLLSQVRDYLPLQPSQAQRRSAPGFRTHEAAQLAAALGRLMDRIRRLHVDSYLTIERTIDARRAKSHFLASMSHDLRSPLSSVLGFTELLLSGYEGDIPERAARRLAHMHKTGRRLLRLLSEILDTAKVESQTVELHPRHCAPFDLINQAVQEARRGRLAEDIPVIIDVPEELRAVHVDPIRFPQALAHLIGHVLDGTQAEAGTYRVRVAARRGRHGDNGQTFDVDVSVERPPSSLGPEPLLPLGTVGLGLALPLARRLVALHGGTIEIVPGTRPVLRASVPLRPR